MNDSAKTVRPPAGQSESQVAAGPKLMAGVIFGLAFGFLLQKGGVGKFNVLVGKLLLPDLLHVSRTAFAVALAGALIIIILALEQFTIR